MDISSLNTYELPLMCGTYMNSCMYYNYLQHCKEWGQANGYSYFFSVDIDEYLMPVDKGVTLMDAFHSYVSSTGRSILRMPKLNFQVKTHRFPLAVVIVSRYEDVLICIYDYSVHSAYTGTCGFANY